MKPVSILLYFSFLLSSVFTSSCKTDNSENNVKVRRINNIADQLYTINADADTVLKGKSGTVLRLYKGTFADQSGNVVSGDIAITLKEAIEPADIVLGGLSTTTNGKMLKTGGMIYLNATADGKALTISKGKFVGGIHTGKNGGQEYEGFYGQRRQRR